jgi:hypothetical protein
VAVQLTPEQRLTRGETQLSLSSIITSRRMLTPNANIQEECFRVEALQDQDRWNSWTSQWYTQSNQESCGTCNNPDDCVPIEDAFGCAGCNVNGYECGFMEEYLKQVREDWKTGSRCCVGPVKEIWNGAERRVFQYKRY